MNDEKHLVSILKFIKERPINHIRHFQYKHGEHDLVFPWGNDRIEVQVTFPRIGVEVKFARSCAGPQFNLIVRTEEDDDIAQEFRELVDQIVTYQLPVCEEF